MAYTDHPPHVQYPHTQRAAPTAKQARTDTKTRRLSTLLFYASRANATKCATTLGNEEVRKETTKKRVNKLAMGCDNT